MTNNLHPELERLQIAEKPLLQLALTIAKGHENLLPGSNRLPLGLAEKLTRHFGLDAEAHAKLTSHIRALSQKEVRADADYLRRYYSRMLDEAFRSFNFRLYSPTAVDQPYPLIHWHRLSSEAAGGELADEWALVRDEQRRSWSHEDHFKGYVSSEEWILVLPLLRGTPYVSFLKILAVAQCQCNWVESIIRAADGPQEVFLSALYELYRSYSEMADSLLQRFPDWSALQIKNWAYEMCRQRDRIDVSRRSFHTSLHRQLVRKKPSIAVDPVRRAARLGNPI